jgi:hypothetical protein
MLVINESLHRHRYKFLWDLLFERHPYGAYIRGKWEGMGDAKTDIPSDKLILELLEHTPTMLLLDEFQTWFEALTNTEQSPWKHRAFNFIQILSEIAKERPDLLVLVISVLNGSSDAYQQVHRVNPIIIDFKAGGSPERIQQDRRRMLLHRLFDNRMQITQASIEALIAVHVSEYLRLYDVPASEHARKSKEFTESWPYSPLLLRLLEEQVLIATAAQETRDLIRILANLYKSQGATSPVLTAADFHLDSDASGIGALLDSVADEHNRTLRTKAQQNIIVVCDAVPDHENIAPHLQELVGALWLRSIAIGNIAGAEPATLQVDITRDQAIDDNAFKVELAAIKENSFNIHEEGFRLVFREAENPRAKLMAYARNDKLFVDGTDRAQLAKQIRYVIGGDDEVAKAFRVIALPKLWQTDPWSELDEKERPEHWDNRLLILVLPETPRPFSSNMGHWLKDHLQKRRNTIRFLLPRTGLSNAFQDRDLLILTRASMKAQEWIGQSPEYKRLHQEFQTALRDFLKKRFDRFAILERWNYVYPNQCKFCVEGLKEQSIKSSQIPQNIEEVLVHDLFVPEDFEELVLQAAAENASVSKLLRELQEPRPNELECIPWLGEAAMKDRLLRLCARGKIAINLRGLEYIQVQPGEDANTAWLRLRAKLAITGRQLDDVLLMPPTVTSTTGGTASDFEEFASGHAYQPLNDGSTLPLSASMNSASGTQPAGGIFNSNPTGASRKPRIPLSNPPTSSLNLLGKIDKWGIGPATQIADVAIKVSAASGAQLKELIKKLPDGMIFELSLEKEDTDGH